jgi:hypothetical protein
MEDTDAQRGDEVEEDIAPEDVEGRIRHLERIMQNFAIRGKGMSGNIHEGFNYGGQE